MDLPGRVQSYLTQKQAEVDNGADPGSIWERARRTKTMGIVFDVLVRMAGRRERCMYCEDSRGTDIEHFRPKRVYRDLSFRWSNLLLVCTGCNRKKGDRFPLTPSGDPLLIDPSSEDPWDYLFFDGETGLIVARWLPGSDQPDPKGQVTASDEYFQINIEAVSEGRLRTKRNLERAVNAFLQNVSPEASEDLRQAVADNNDYGLSLWFFNRDGTEEEPFCRLKDQHPNVWLQMVSLTS